jgi:hypothetical protein
VELRPTHALIWLSSRCRSKAERFGAAVRAELDFFSLPLEG